MKVYIILSSAPMGDELLGVCSTPEKALERIIEDLKKEVTSEEIEKSMKELGLSMFLLIYEYSIFECEVDGKDCKYVSFGKQKYDPFGIPGKTRCGDCGKILTDVDERLDDVFFDHGIRCKNAMRNG